MIQLSLSPKQSDAHERTPDLNDSPQAESGQPTREMIFDVLCDERRRYVLECVLQHETGTVSLDELVTQVEALENERAPTQGSADVRNSVSDGLRETHLPKMNVCGLIEYDSDRGTVTRTRATHRAGRYLNSSPERDSVWSSRYLALSGLLSGITGLTWVGLYPFGGLDAVTIAVLTILAFGILALVHTRHTYRESQKFGYGSGGEA